MKCRAWVIVPKIQTGGRSESAGLTFVSGLLFRKFVYNFLILHPHRMSHSTAHPNSFMPWPFAMASAALIVEVLRDPVTNRHSFR